MTAIRILSSLVFMSGVLVTDAHAGRGENYVKGLQGNFRGGGTVAAENGKKVRVRCSSRNTLNTGSRSLSIRGRCASSQGTYPLRGTIRYSADGTRLTTVSLATGGGRVTGGVLSGNRLTISGRGKDDAGKSVPFRATINGGGGRYSISLSARINGKWSNRGTLSFRK